MSIAEQLRQELSFLTVGGLPDFVKKLGGYNWDKITLGKEGDFIGGVYIHELRYYVSDIILADNVEPIFFYGGPTGGVEYRGTLLTFAVDRCLYVSIEKGIHYVRDLMVQTKQADTSLGV